jgi:mannose-6-phosphate isomerase-like protein (cupin superfamily)
MVTLISEPSIIEAAGSPPKRIAEFFGRVTSATGEVSIAVMESPMGWAEPGQRPEFDEYTVVIDGELQAETEQGLVVVGAGQGLLVPGGEWVRYSTPGEAGARYVSICMPAFSPDTVHRDGTAG